LMNPAFFAISGSFNTIIKNPAINGAIVKAAVVSQITLDFFIFSHSVCMAVIKGFIVIFHLLSYAFLENKFLNLLPPLLIGKEDIPHTQAFWKFCLVVGLLLYRRAEYNLGHLKMRYIL